MISRCLVCLRIKFQLCKTNSGAYFQLTSCTRYSLIPKTTKKSSFKRVVVSRSLNHEKAWEFCFLSFGRWVICCSWRPYPVKLWPSEKVSAQPLLVLFAKMKSPNWTEGNKPFLKAQLLSRERETITTLIQYQIDGMSCLRELNFRNDYLIQK